MILFTAAATTEIATPFVFGTDTCVYEPAPAALLRSAYRALESSAERSARLAEELDDARRQLSAEGQGGALLALGGELPRLRV
ncbi:hypothetical protein [Pseudomonas aeruginosa]|uniref:hypothetical protein n=1 Tax=Pseudomonas aeruginosa TaxID=287 RepID=UPI00117BA00B|nr:hypothetical protein [Pseudomonas aeruginosa]